jgi:hypothetical protein
MSYFKKLRHPYIWKRMFYERATEPVHLNLMALIVYLFGSYRLKIDFDLVIRQQHAYSLLNVADQAKNLGHKKVSIFEFGVAAGAGLLNLQNISKKITAITGVDFEIYGFDTGAGMPPPSSYKDHPELYAEGDFPMNFEALKQRLDPNTKLIIGPIKNSLIDFTNQDFSSAPIAFISIDVDYYSSTVDCLQLLKCKATDYLPRVLVYLDDLEDLSHNTYCGELAAITEFTNQNPLRPIERHTFLRSFRIFKNAPWIDHIFQAHILDHPHRNLLKSNRLKVVLENPHL